MPKTQNIHLATGVNICCKADTSKPLGMFPLSTFHVVTGAAVPGRSAAGSRPRSSRRETLCLLPVARQYIPAAPQRCLPVSNLNSVPTGRPSKWPPPNNYPGKGLSCVLGPHLIPMQLRPPFVEPGSGAGKPRATMFRRAVSTKRMLGRASPLTSRGRVSERIPRCAP